MRILITGGAGFQGSHLAGYLIKRGHRVTFLNTWSERAIRTASSIARGAIPVWGSITDPEIVSKVIRDQDVVFHLAAYINVDQSIASPQHTVEVNVLGTQNVLEAVRHTGNRLIYASSCEVYGDGHENLGAALPESAELRPNSPYAASKAAGDRLCHAYYRSFGTDVVIVRPSNVFGEYQKVENGALIPRLVHLALAGKSLTLFGNGRQERDYLYVSDLVAAYNLVLENPGLSGSAINFGTGQSVRIGDIVNRIGKEFGVKIIRKSARPGEVSRFLLDTSKASSYGWKPKVAFWKGLDRYIAWARKNRPTT